MKVTYKKGIKTLYSKEFTEALSEEQIKKEDEFIEKLVGDDEAKCVTITFNKGVTSLMACNVEDIDMELIDEYTVILK